MRLLSLNHRSLSRLALPALLGALVNLGCSTEAEPADEAGAESIKGDDAGETSSESASGGTQSEDTTPPDDKDITDGTGGSGGETEEMKEKEEPDEKELTQDEELEVEEETEEGEISNAAASLWYLLSTEERTILSNILSPEAALVITDLEGAEFGLYPWSPDGKIVAQVVDDEVVFYSLEAEFTVLASYPAEGYKEVYAWIPGFGPLLSTGEEFYLSGLGAMKPDGTLLTLAEGTDETPLHISAISPQGDEVIWGAGDVNEGYDLWHQSFEDGEATDSSVIAAHAGTPPVTAIWDSSGAWFAYGIGGNGDLEQTGTYAWNSSRPSVEKVSPEGVGFNASFYFSADSSLFVMHTSDDSVGTNGLATLSLGNDAVGTTYELTGDGYSPAVWSNLGSYLMGIQSEDAFLLLVNPDGSFGERIPFPDFEYGCQVVWLSETTFVANTCFDLDDLGYLLFGTVDGQSIETTRYEAPLSPGMTVSTDASCLISYNEVEIFVGVANVDDYAALPVATNGGSLSFMDITPDASNIIWTENGTDQYRIELVDCVPQGDPIAIGSSDMPITSATLVDGGSN